MGKMGKVHRPNKPNKSDLIRLYKVINSIIKDDDCYYTSKELEGKEKVE